MVNCNFKNIDEMKDPVSHFVYDLMCSYHMPKKLAYSFIKYGARDHARVPMQWNSSVNGGFNEGHETWQCVNPAYKEINVETDLNSSKSIYRFYQKLLEIKKTNEIAIYGATREYDHENKKIIAYSRRYMGEKLFIAGNFSKKQANYKLPDWVNSSNVLLNNYPDLAVKDGVITLKPYQAVVFN